MCVGVCTQSYRACLLPWRVITPHWWGACAVGLLVWALS
jgi:hypothetical protein